MLANGLATQHCGFSPAFDPFHRSSGRCCYAAGLGERVCGAPPSRGESASDDRRGRGYQAGAVTRRPALAFRLGFCPTPRLPFDASLYAPRTIAAFRSPP